MSNWKVYVGLFAAGLLSGWGLSCHSTHIKKEDTLANVQAEKAVIKPNGTITLYRPKYIYKKVTLDKIVPRDVTGLYVGLGEDAFHPEKINGAVGINLGPIFPLAVISPSSVQGEILIHF